MSLDDFIFSGFIQPDLYDEMYQKFLQDPSQVDASWKDYFSRLNEGEEAPVSPSLEEPVVSRDSPFSILDEVKSHQLKALKHVERQPVKASDENRILNLIQAYRHHGHLMAKVNPIEAFEKPSPLALNLKYLGFSEDELDKAFPTCGLTEKEHLPLREIVKTLQEIYCGNIGVEYMGFISPEAEMWLQQHIEPSKFKIQLRIDQKQMILQHLNKSGLFEWFLQTKYVGQKRFSLEGGETLIPMVAAIIETGANLGIEQFVVGMAHRGRLNVLCNILDKSYSDIFSEFEDNYIPESFEGSGDVKYHKGFSSEILTTHGHRVQISITPNPSHLESVNPVVEGQVRSLQTQMDDLNDQNRAVPVLIHGDAAISGQGVVYETMQLSDLKGYSTGGSVHIVINNQIGFTTLPAEGRSTLYCTDIAKAFGAPVFHVNAEDPEGCIYATNLAVEMRQKFHCDVFIDLNCYRKYGHNEADEPAFTQPLEYQLIRQKKSIREIYRDDLIQQGILEKYLAEELEEEFKKGLKQALKGTKELIRSKPPVKIEKKKIDRKELFKKTETDVSDSVLKKVAKTISQIPEGFTIHRKLKQIVKKREEMVTKNGEDNPIDWGMAETLAYGTLLSEGTSVRISGQDSCRGTFSHRHAIWMDQKKERGYYPLKSLATDKTRFDIYNSPLSEYAVLGFEYGYTLCSPDSLVIWEAQFGDFFNGAQIIVDQYLSTGEQKWGQTSNIVLLLPHGYEGQGPEHSSGRIERFLTLCGDNNLTVANPTTPAQLFHLLRRQIKGEVKRPLIIFSPKALLRHPDCVSTLDGFTEGTFKEVLEDPAAPKSPKRMIFCSGKVYYDLITERERRKVKDVAIYRIEQLYPLNTGLIEELIASHDEVEEFQWVQEEPSNMGPWSYMRPRLQKLLPEGKKIQYIGRERSASPATGSLTVHKHQLRTLLNSVFPEEKLDVNVGMMHPV